MPIDRKTAEAYPTEPCDWTRDDVTRFWKTNNKSVVRCELSGRVGVFAAVIHMQAFVRLPGGTEFRTHCANLVVLDEEATGETP